MAKETILLVDDDPGFLKMFESYLSSQGLTPMVAHGGEEALKLIEREPVAVAVSDQRMPGMKGVTLLSLIKQKYPDTVTALITGYSDITAVVDAVNQGSIHRYISKQALPEEIALMVADCLKKYRDNQEILKLVRANRRLIRMIAAEQSLSAVGIFGEVVSDKIDEIVRGLSGYLFKNAGHSNPQQLAASFRYLDLALQKIQRMSHTVKQEKASTGTIENVHALIEEELSLAQGEAARYGICVTIDCVHPHAATNTPIGVDDATFRNILRPLVENAILFSPVHSRDIRVVTHFDVHPEDPHVAIDIANVLEPEAPRNTQDFFVPFYTSFHLNSPDQNHKLTPEGYNFSASCHFGVGLPLAQWLAARNGGLIEMHQEKNLIQTRVILPLTPGFCRPRGVSRTPQGRQKPEGEGIYE